MAFDFWETPIGRFMRGLPPYPPLLWIPQYIPVNQLTVLEPDPGQVGGVATQPLSQQDYPTKESAQHLATLYGATFVSEEGLFLSGGPDSSPSGAIEYTLNWTDNSTGRTVLYKVHAGTLAYYYKPADGPSAAATLANPDLAVIECRAAINAARMDALRQVR